MFYFGNQRRENCQILYNLEIKYRVYNIMIEKIGASIKQFQTKTVPFGETPVDASKELLLIWRNNPDNSKKKRYNCSSDTTYRRRKLSDKNISISIGFFPKSIFLCNEGLKKL